MSARVLQIAAFAIAWTGGASGTIARAQAPTPSGGEPTAALPSIREWKLKNGLTVAHVERPGLPMVAVQVWYQFGSADEPPNQHGAARSFERLMFAGSQRVRNDDHRRFIEQAGGDTSALVAEDVSAFHSAVPVERLDLVLELEAQRMRHLLVRPEALAEVRPILIEDARRQESNPVLRSYRALIGMVFSGRSYAWSPVGFAQDIEKVSLEQVKALYDAYFVPGNALVVVVGGVSTDTVTAAVERWFGPLAAGPAPRRPQPIGKPMPETELRQVLYDSPIGLLMGGYPLPRAEDPDVLALQVAGLVLTGGPSSRLQRRLVPKKLAEEVGGQVLLHREGGILVAFARCAPACQRAADTAFVDEVDKLAARGPTAEEVRRAKGQILGAAWFGIESATGLANQIGLSWGRTGKPAGFLADLAALEKLGPADVKRAAGKYLTRTHLAMIVSHPGPAPSTGGKP